MARQLLNDFLKKQQEEGIKEVEAMKQHPLSFEEAKAQVERIHQAALKAAEQRKKGNKTPNNLDNKI